MLSTLTGMTDWNTKTAADFGTRAEKLWKDNGTEVIRLSAGDQKTFMDAVRPLGDQFLGQHKNDGVGKMYGLLKEAAKRHM